MKFTPEKKNKEKTSSFYNSYNKEYANQKISNVSSTMSATNISKNITQENRKKLITPLDFIKQKKKFNIQNLFDANGAKIS